MNELNYASLEASKKLVDAGIVLEAEYYWIRVANSPMMLHNNIHGADEYYPAPSMAEVWRELPDINQGARIYLTKIGNQTQVGYGWPYMPSSSIVGQNINPTDAAIELKVWLKGEGEMTNEDKKIVADYMGWPEDEILIGYCTAPNKMAHFDLNDAGLVVKEMVKRGEWDSFIESVEENTSPICETWNRLFAWLFDADNFFKAFVEWRKSL
jgi:hypothetical protein